MLNVKMLAPNEMLELKYEQIKELLDHVLSDDELADEFYDLANTVSEFITNNEEEFDDKSVDCAWNYVETMSLAMAEVMAESSCEKSQFYFE